MKSTLVLAALLSASSVHADPLAVPEQLRAMQERIDKLKNDPCLSENQFLNYYEILFEAAPRHSMVSAKGAPPASVILTLDRCEASDRDHVENKPMTPTAERWYTDGNWGLILTTELGSDKTHVTVVSKKNGQWVTSGQMGSFVTTELFDVWDKGRADIRLALYEERGVKLPYSVRVSIRPSWSR